MQAPDPGPIRPDTVERRTIGAIPATLGSSVLAAVTFFGGIGTDFAQRQAGEEFVAIAHSTGVALRAYESQIEELRADKRLILDGAARIRAEREELRRELAYTKRLLDLERGLEPITP